MATWTRHQQIRRLCTGGLEFDDDSACFRYKGAVIRGITKPLKSVFWPEYAFVSASQRTGSSPSGKVPNHKRNSKRTGIRRGTRVDREITQIVNALSHSRVHLRDYLAHYKQAPHDWSVELRYHAKRMHAFTLSALTALAKKCLIPVHAQVPVCSISHKLATAVDVVCTDEATGHIVLVELKTGFQAYATKGNGAMRAPLAHMTNHPQNQHFVQLLVTKRLFCNWAKQRRLSNATHPKVKAVVLRVSNEGVWFKWMPAQLEKLSAVVWKQLTTTIKQRRASKGRSRPRPRKAKKKRKTRK